MAVDPQAQGTWPQSLSTALLHPKGRPHRHILLSAFVQAAGGDPDFEEKTPKLFDLLYGNIAKYNGSISAEHGIGQLKRDQLSKVKSPAILNTMRSIKSALDPKNLMNPGKVI